MDNLVAGGGVALMLPRCWESTWKTLERCLQGHLLPVYKVGASAGDLYLGEGNT